MQHCCIQFDLYRIKAYQIVQFMTYYVRRNVQSKAKTLQKVVKMLPIKAFGSKVYRNPRKNIRVSKA